MSHSVNKAVLVHSSIPYIQWQRQPYPPLILRSLRHRPRYGIVYAFFTNPVTVSSICLSDNPSKDCAFSFPNSTTQLAIHQKFRIVSSQRTISSIHLWQRPLRLADKNRDLGIVLLHSRIGAREKRPATPSARFPPDSFAGMNPIDVPHRSALL